MNRKARQPKTLKRTYPVVNGERTSFVELGKLFGRTRGTMAIHYNAIRGPVTMAKLRAQVYGTTNRLLMRDERITFERQAMGRPLASLSIRYGLTPQRIQQIAGPLT